MTREVREKRMEIISFLKKKSGFTPRQQQTIASKRHEVFTLDQRRVALSALDTKRYVMTNGQTRALGHYKNNK